MLISTISPLSLDDGLRTCPHSTRPHRSMRTNPLPSVCQSPSGVSAAASSTSRTILEIRAAVSGAGRATSVDDWVEGAPVSSVVAWTAEYLTRLARLHPVSRQRRARHAALASAGG